MNKTLTLFFAILSIVSLKAQDFTGQWKGEFIDKSTSNGAIGSDKCEYVLELDVDGNKVSGSSYTYFTDGGKKYYTICKVEGFVEPKKKYIEIKEIARIKTNIPNNINNCLQIHKLTYFKQGNIETIEGNWVPGPTQSRDCGFGSTELTRRTLLSAFPEISKKNNQQSIAKNSKEKKQISDETAKEKTQITKPVLPNKTAEIKESDKQNKEDISTKKITAEPKNTVSEKIETPAKLEKRKTQVIKTIEVENRYVKVDLYDNGEIDGDSISLFYNKKLLFSNKKLSDKPISLNLEIDEDVMNNELVMFAENLGSIPPNTALMIVTDGPNRYEVRITSDLEKSGVINFIHKPRVH